MRSMTTSRTTRFAGAILAVTVMLVLGTSATAGAGEDHGEKNTWGEVCPTTTVPPTTVPPTTAPPTTEAPTTTTPGATTTTPPTSVVGSTTVAPTTTAPAGPTTTAESNVLAATTTVLPPSGPAPESAAEGRQLAFTGQSLVSTLGIALTLLVIGASVLGSVRRGRAVDA
jgi:hypothetical protein